MVRVATAPFDIIVGKEHCYWSLVPFILTWPKLLVPLLEYFLLILTTQSCVNQEFRFLGDRCMLTQFCFCLLACLFFIMSFIGILGILNSIPIGVVCECYAGDNVLKHNNCPNNIIHLGLTQGNIRKINIINTTFYSHLCSSSPQVFKALCKDGTNI